MCEYNPTSFTYLRLEAGMLSLSNSVENRAKIFNDGVDSSRMGISLSMGFRFGLFEKEFAGDCSHH
jgi:hypothetical protein